MKKSFYEMNVNKVMDWYEKSYYLSNIYLAEKKGEKFDEDIKTGLENKTLKLYKEVRKLADDYISKYGGDEDEILQRVKSGTDDVDIVWSSYSALFLDEVVPDILKECFDLEWRKNKRTYK